MKKADIKFTEKTDVCVSCPNCDNWEEQPIDSPRNKLYTMPLIRWEESKKGVEVSAHKCLSCDQEFSISWDYKEEKRHELPDNFENLLIDHQRNIIDEIQSKFPDIENLKKEITPALDYFLSKVEIIIEREAEKRANQKFEDFKSTVVNTVKHALNRDTPVNDVFLTNIINHSFEKETNMPYSYRLKSEMRRRNIRNESVGKIVNRLVAPGSKDYANIAYIRSLVANEVEKAQYW